MSDESEYAFPVPGHAGGWSPKMGMSLRDYFAAKAMQATYRHDEASEHIALRAYSVADAMLKARAE